MTNKGITVLDRVDISDNGVISIRFDKQILVGKEVKHREWHRTAIMPGADIDKAIKAVNTHLAAMDYGPVSERDVLDIKAKVADAQGKM